MCARPIFIPLETMKMPLSCFSTVAFPLMCVCGRARRPRALTSIGLTSTNATGNDKRLFFLCERYLHLFYLFRLVKNYACNNHSWMFEWLVGCLWKLNTGKKWSCTILAKPHTLTNTWFGSVPFRVRELVQSICENFNRFAKAIQPFTIVSVTFDLDAFDE